MCTKHVIFFLIKSIFFTSHGRELVKTFPLMYQSLMKDRYINKVRVISALRHKSKFNFELFWKEIQILGFPCCSTRENLSIGVSITNVGLILTKLRWILFSGYGQTDTILEYSYGNMSAHKKFQFKTQN